MQPLLRVSDLTVSYLLRDQGERVALDGLTFDVQPAESIGLLGESGSGKTTLGLTLLGLLPYAGRIRRGSMIFRGEDLLALSEHELRQIRGAGISMIYQEPGAALNPVLRIGEQLSEVLRAHQPLSRERLREQVAFLLAQVGFDRETAIDAAYPHQLSGGQQQRVAIAQAIACNPALVIADEPTTALDPVTQLEILDLLRSLQSKLRLALLVITHDSGVLARAVDRVLVIREGRIVEEGPIREMVYKPLHAYTRGLLNSTVPTVRQKSQRCSTAPAAHDPQGQLGLGTPSSIEVNSSGRQSFGREQTPGSHGAREPEALTPHRGSQRPDVEPLLSGRSLEKVYLQGRWLSGRRHTVLALRGVELNLRLGSTLALVGASGSGKSTLARCLACLEKPDSGEVWYAGLNLTTLTDAELIPFRRQIQLLFQDPGASLNPRFTALEIISEPLLVVHPGAKKESCERARELMELVRLRADWGARMPHQFSAGQRRRLAIARALALEPRVLILDEALAGLDSSTRTQIVDLLLELQATRSLTYLYISHDLGLVAHLADQVAVLDRGLIVETAATPELLTNPQNPHTNQLVTATMELSSGPGSLR